MKRLIQLVAKLYPKAWRKRYGVEFEALLKEIDSGWRSFFSVLKGALHTQIVMGNSGRVLAAAALAGTVVGLGVSVGMPKQYASTSIIQVTPGFAGAPVADQQVGDPLSDLAAVVLSRPSLTRIIDTVGLDRGERGNVPLEDTIDSIKRAVSVKLAGPSQGATKAFVVQFVYGDPVIAQRVTQELVGSILYENVREAIAGKATPVNLEVMQSATLSCDSLGPRQCEISAAGLLAGTFIGLLLLAFRRAPEVA